MKPKKIRKRKPVSEAHEDNIGAREVQSEGESEDSRNYQILQKKRLDDELELKRIKLIEEMAAKKREENER